MKLCVLGKALDKSHYELSKYEPESDPAHYVPGRQYSYAKIEKAKAKRQVELLSQQNFDVFLNFCDCDNVESDTAGIEVVTALEGLDCAFTGAGSSYFHISREMMKMSAHGAGIKTPRHAFLNGESALEPILDTFRFPLIVKRPREHNSVGLTRDSVVTSAAGLRQQVAQTLAATGEALVEEFIAGREFTVLCAESAQSPHEAVTYQPVECTFPPGETFKHFELKWHDDHGSGVLAIADATLEAELRHSTSEVFLESGGSGYCRADFRQAADGTLYLLEINTNPSIFFPPAEAATADDILLLDPAGHRGFLDHMIACALRRQKERRRLWRVGYTEQRGWGIFAQQSLAAGQRAMRQEETAHRLISRAHAERHWSEEEREGLYRYGYQLSDDLFAFWSENPNEWAPINHSCDPSCWFDGLDVVARRDIACGEELTLDYATLYAFSMPEFPCQCQSRSCRKVVRGSDFLLPEIGERYGEHLSLYIRALRSAQLKLRE
jgi:D-alanine-D-alanine ligase